VLSFIVNILSITFKWISVLDRRSLTIFIFWIGKHKPILVWTYDLTLHSLLWIKYTASMSLKWSHLEQVYQQSSLVLVKLWINFSMVRSCSQKSHPNNKLQVLRYKRVKGSIKFCIGFNEFHLIIVCIFVWVGRTNSSNLFCTTPIDSIFYYF
jgi:hypothetical protein